MTEAEKLVNSKHWRKWGPYLSERQWGSVREDYSANGDAWNYLSHDMSRSKAYRWGEDGIAGISDRRQYLCMALALWNEKDPILKERLFGLTNTEGNHGEDVKELYYYLDNTPSHSYMKMLYKYPQNAFPYNTLVQENRQRNRHQPEFELADTGIFDDGKYFDVYIEYAKAAPEDILIKYTIYNRGNETAPLQLLPTLWYRNRLEWKDGARRPYITQTGRNELLLETKHIGDYFFYTEGEPAFLFTENESNNERLYGTPNKTQFVKDGFHERVINGDTGAVNHEPTGTKAAPWYKLQIPAQGSVSLRFRLSNDPVENPFAHFDAIFEAQQQLADDFYISKYNIQNNDDIKRIQRQGWAGMLWNKQYYIFSVDKWLNGDEGQTAMPGSRLHPRNPGWEHLIANDVISMPDKWEFPWFAAWDLAFHCITLAGIDPEFAKDQLLLLLKNRYMHPNGQLPAYEWNFSDVNPPVQALAAWKVYQQDAAVTGRPDKQFLEKVFHKLMLNFTWWVNRKDSEGNNIFQGGFLGLDNIGIFDRSAPLPGGGHLEQADGTSWMAVYSLNMMRIAMELALDNNVYEDLAIKFGEHFFYIAGSMANMGDIEGRGLWDEEDGFYYDVIRMPDGSWNRLRLRSIIGLIPLFAVEVIEEAKWRELSGFASHMRWFLGQRPDLALLVSRWETTSDENKHLLSLLRGHRMKGLLRRMLDENEFLSPYGVRSLSKIYEKTPFVYRLDGQEFVVQYNPAESDIGMFGGNSNWRGPVWLPLNYLIIESLYRFHDYYSDDFKVEYPTHSGNFITLKQVADELAKRLQRIFVENNGKRPLTGNENPVMQTAEFKEHILFFEYFNGDTGKGLGASHQTGWTGLIADLF